MSDKPYQPTFRSPFDPSRDTPSGGDGEKLDPPKGSRVKLLLLTWGIALVAACPHPKGIVFLPWFPSGLEKMLVEMLALDPAIKQGGFVLGWFAYLFLCVAVVTTSRKFWFYVFYIVLVGLLLTNVAGCHAGWAELSKIN